MRIRELFRDKVTRDIPPVVYSHDQRPETLAAEVREYILTGGYPEGDPRRKRLPQGIHEELVHLLRALHAERTKAGGPDLPAAWISGFYGSGKSIFVKLLGLALDGRELPDGTPLAEALLQRDTSPLAGELRKSWEVFTSGLQSMAVVFDIGTEARDDEPVHTVAVRQIQARLGYCPTSDLVADYELRLEQDGNWEAFLDAAETTLGMPWSEAKSTQLADDHFSHVLHALWPDRYQDPTSWVDSHAGRRSPRSAGEAVRAVEAMLARRAPGRTLFVVVDEVSQYVHDNENRMLKLQSLVSELGSRLSGAVWLLATGQQRLEETAEGTNLHKLRDRFPTRLRVHLSATNIRDVVHRRLLRKTEQGEEVLRELFQRHRPGLSLYAYGCEEITEEDFLEVYPLLPGHIDLLMQITSRLRDRSSRARGDSQAIRGLLQLLGDLFREQGLAEREVGELITLDTVFELLHTSLPADLQATLARIFEHCANDGDEVAARAARAVAMLELIQETTPTTSELVARCLYSRLGEGKQLPAVTEALERLRGANFLGYSEKTGFKVQSSTGQEWQRERDALGVTGEESSRLVRDSLEALMAELERPRLGNRPFPWTAFYSDGRSFTDDQVRGSADDAVVAVDFRYLTNTEERRSPEWVRGSDGGPLRDRIVWVVGDPGPISDLARQLARSLHMVRRYKPRRASLTSEKQHLLLEEQGRSEDLITKLRRAVAEAFLSGTFYFRSRRIQAREKGGTFTAALAATAQEVLPDLYPYFEDLAVTDEELKQLFAKSLTGPSPKFLGERLGILSLDAGRYQATCEGEVPRRVLEHLEKEKGLSGAALLAHFGRPPYGYAADVVRATTAGLLRGDKLRIRTDGGLDISSYLDPGVQDLFLRTRDFRRADFFPATEAKIRPRDITAICRLFEHFLDVRLEYDKEAIADAVNGRFPAERERLREVERLLDRLPHRPPLPPALAKLAGALEDCRRSRQVEPTVLAVKRHLDALRDGFEQLGIYRTEVTEETIGALRSLYDVLEHRVPQIEEVREDGDLAEEALRLREGLAAERPWRSASALVPLAAKLREEYRARRRTLLGEQERLSEAARDRVRARDGFESLTPDQTHRVLKPLAEAQWETSEDAVAPSLEILAATFPARLEQAEAEAHDLLDRELERSKGREIVKIELRLHGRELASRQDLENLLRELEERIGKELDSGKRVRIL